MNITKPIALFLSIFLVMVGSLSAADDSGDQELEVAKTEKNETLSGVLVERQKGHWALKLDESSKSLAGLDRVDVWDGANFDVSREWVGCHLTITADLIFPKSPSIKPFLSPDFLSEIKGYPPSLRSRKIYPDGTEEMDENSPVVNMKGTLKVNDDVGYFWPDIPINAGNKELTVYGLDELEVYGWPQSDDPNIMEKMAGKHLQIKARLYQRLHPKWDTKVLIDIQDWKLDQ